MIGLQHEVLRKYNTCLKLEAKQKQQQQKMQRKPASSKTSPPKKTTQGRQYNHNLAIVATLKLDDGTSLSITSNSFQLFSEYQHNLLF
jgi:hypothetical protein